MGYVYHSLLIAQDNLAIALRDEDIPRARLVNELLFHLGSDALERKLAANRCLDAVQGPGSAGVAVMFHVHPVKTGDLGAMTRDALRFSAALRPSPEANKKIFDDHSPAYRTMIADCEQSIGAPQATRSLPDRLPRK
jgi:hypothetical protein